jgi:UDP:flavonoid glycosyltransferase YjiC (YdhE family)
MRIAIITLGSRGDIQPYIALGQGLKEAGHMVRLLAWQDFEELTTSHGLEFGLIRGNAQEMVGESKEFSELLEQGNFVKIIMLIAKETQHMAIELLEDGLVACRGMDLIITGLTGIFISIPLAEKLKIPLLQTGLIPFAPTRAFPSIVLPQTLPTLGGAFNYGSQQLVRQLTWPGMQAVFNQARKKVLGLPPGSYFKPFYSERSKGLPMLHGFSPSVVPRPADWGTGQYVTGYWFLDQAEDWSPPAALLDFLQAGPAPVYIGFGSMSSRKPEETADLVLKALQQAGQRALLFSGWGGLQKTDLPDSVLMIDSTPHSWLFPRCAAVVHHGGAGTTAAGLRAGVPSVVVPFFGDQPFWGRRVHDLGVGPAPIPRSKLNIDRLAQAINEAVTDPGMRQRAAALGVKIRAEDGVANAVGIIQNHFAG